MNRQIVRALAEKDIAEVAQNRIAISGAIILSVIFAVVFPLLITQIPVLLPESDQPAFDDLQELIPPQLIDELAELSPEQLPIVLILGYLMAPLFLVLPLMLACIIAAEAFVGEKERKTLEALLYTPATDGELFLGKVLAALIPAIVYTWVNFLVFTLVTNLAGYPVMGRFWFPTPSWLALMVVVVPAVALLGVAVTVIISTRVRTFMEAYQVSGALVLVILVLVVAQSVGLLFLSPLVAVLVGIAFFALDAVLIMAGIRTFSRSELIARV
ncbi:MAG TPA: ABC transporter permease subunit [Methanoregulaceae archaeon]|jgi:ABC-type Na+ efflux pump permease subunit|nr:ABC transporter permease subunit [Methanoregulaceae archaeon]